LKRRLYPVRGAVGGRQRQLQGPELDYQVFLGRQSASCAVRGDARSCKATLGLDQIQYMIHQLLRQPFLGADALGLPPKKTPVGLETRVLALGIAPDLLGELFDQELQLRLFELPLILLGAQRRSLCG